MSNSWPRRLWNWKEMLNFFYNQILFYFALAVTTFIPGWFLLLAVLGKSKTLSLLERFVFSFGLGLIVTDFIAFLFNKTGVPITALSSISGAVVFSAACYGIYKYGTWTSDVQVEKETDSLFFFSKNQLILLILLLFLTFLIKTAYLTGTVAPTATDMGHHTYWAETIARTHKLTDYEGMPDFIIGEHVALSEIRMITGLTFFTAFPVLFLYLMNILGILTVMLLTLRIFKSKNIAVLLLLFLGVLFAVSSPQAKFVSGGVVGNIIGNFLTPLAFYFYFRTFEFLSRAELGSSASKLEAELPSSRRFLSLAVFATFGLFYTHHLTAFIFLFVFAFWVVFYAALNYKNIKNIFFGVWRVVWSPSVMTTLAIGLVFFFYVFTPTYIKGNAVETAVGAPSKATREGLTLTNLKDTVGEPRAALGIVGLFLLALFYKKRNPGYAIAAAWAVMLFIMSNQPDLLFINLPSSRIGNYLTYPLAILGAFGFWVVFRPDDFTSPLFGKTKSVGLVSQPLIRSAFAVLLVFVVSYGFYDSADAFKKTPDFAPMNQTFDATAYLAQNSTGEDMILKDHNYMTGDTWMKLFLMRGYKYPLSRSYFKRYEDPTKPREMCTLFMISTPDSDDAKNCFSETGTDFIMVNPRYDTLQFQKLDNFDKIYMTESVAVYYRK